MKTNLLQNIKIDEYEVEVKNIDEDEDSTVKVTKNLMEPINPDSVFNGMWRDDKLDDKVAYIDDVDDDDDADDADDAAAAVIPAYFTKYVKYKNKYIKLKLFIHKYPKIVN